MAIKKAAKVKRKEFDLPDIKNILDQPIKFKNRKFKFTDKQKTLLDITTLICLYCIIYIFF